MSFLKLTTISSPLSTARTVRKAINKSNSSGKRHGQRTITFRETDAFYNELDELVKTKKKVIIKFQDDKLDENSPLWKRLSKCENWEDVAESIQTDSSLASKFVQPSLVNAFTGGEIFLIAFIATLIAGLAVYAIYKGRKVKIRVKDGDKEGEIVIE